MADESKRGLEDARWTDALLLLGLILVVFASAIFVMGGLSFPFYRDEIDYWEQTLEFVASWPPGLDQLRSYGEPMTPLSFLVWGAVEQLTGAGVVGMRLTNLVVSVATLLLIGWRTDVPDRRGLLACVGLLLFPYWVPLSIVLYTDMIAVFWVVLGLWLYARERGAASGLAFVLAIATRQYMVTFPAALLAAELAPFVLRRAPLRVERVLPLIVAGASLLGWVAFFGGLGPRDGLDVYPTHMEAIIDVTPAYGLYFLACVGAYFVVPEFVLFRRWREPLLPLLTGRNAVLAVAVLVAFVAFPPPEGITLGPLNRAALWALPPDVLGPVSLVVRVALYAVLAWLTCVRFARIDVVFWILLSRALMMTVVWEGWEKYNTALVAALWYVCAASDLSRPIELWGLARGDGGAATGTRASGTAQEA